MEDGDVLWEGCPPDHSPGTLVRVALKTLEDWDSGATIDRALEVTEYRKGVAGGSWFRVFGGLESAALEAACLALMDVAGRLEAVGVDLADRLDDDWTDNPRTRRLEATLHNARLELDASYREQNRVDAALVADAVAAREERDAFRALLVYIGEEVEEARRTVDWVEAEAVALSIAAFLAGPADEEPS